MLGSCGYFKSAIGTQISDLNSIYIIEKYSSKASGNDVSADLVISMLKYSGRIMQAASPPPKTEYIAKSLKAKSLAFKAPISLSKSDTQRRYTKYITL